MTMPELPPVAGAKIELLRRLQSSGSCEATLLADELFDARTLFELAERAQGIAVRLGETDGTALADSFWTEAKAILLKWRKAGRSSH